MKIINNQIGDTIVEVLIAVAVVSLVLAGAYTTTNHSLKATQQAQEHSTALKYAEGQLERLRSVSSPSDTADIYTKDNFCMSGSVTKPDTDPACKLTNGVDYNITINRSGASPAYVFVVKVSWNNIYGNGTDNVTLSYKLDK